MAPYILGFTAIAFVFSVIFELFNGRNNQIGPVAITTAIISLLINWVAVYLLTLPFSNPLTGGYIVLFFVNLILPTIVSAAFGSSNGSTNGASIGVTLIIAAFVISMVISIFTTPAWCDDNGLKAKIALLDLQPAPVGQAFHETSLDQLIRVPASAAITKAGNELSGGENVSLGNYLKPNRAYIQTVQGIPGYVVDLAVTQALGFRAAGSTVPGYLWVNAVDSNSKAELRTGYQFHYVPTGRFSLDLDRKVYFDFQLPNNKLIKDLDGMEINDDLTPSYSGTIMSHVISYKATTPTGVYFFDPATGKGEIVALADVSTKMPWLDRIYPLDWVVSQIKLWGSFANHESCTPNSNGQVQIDSYNDVVTPNGIEYQITMTGMGDDPSMTQLITVDPTTGKGFIYPLTGKSVESIKDAFAPLTKKLRVDGLNVDECELHAIDGVYTVYCIFTGADQYGNTNVGGYGFVALDNADEDGDYALGITFDEAYNEYLQIRSNAGGNTVVSNTANDVTITGIVASNEWFGDSDSGSRLINVIGEDGTSYWFVADGSSKNAAAAVPNKKVTITGYQREGQEFMTVRYINTEGVPDFGSNLLESVEDLLQNLFGTSLK